MQRQTYKGMKRNAVPRSRNHCRNIKAKMLSLYTADLHVALNIPKVLSVEH